MKTRAIKVLKEMGYNVINTYTDDGKVFIFLALGNKYQYPYEITYNSETNCTKVKLYTNLPIIEHDSLNLTKTFIAYYNKLYA